MDSLRLLLDLPDGALASLRRLPADAVARPAPSPAEMLAQLPLHPRTENCLRRYVATGRGEGAWTVARLLSIQGFGLRALADAVEAARLVDAGIAPAGPDRRLEDEIAPLLTARPKLVPDVSKALLERAVRLVAAIVPATAEEVLLRLREADLTRGTLTLAELERATRFLPTGAPFAVLRREGFVLLVAADQLTLAQRIHRVGARLVGRWGSASIDVVSRQLETLETDLVRAVVSARPDFRWLDRRRGWFWFGPGGSRLAQAIEKLVAVAAPLTFESLRLVLARGRSADLVPPVSAVGALCAQLPALRVERDRVWPLGGLGFAGA